MKRLAVAGAVIALIGTTAFAADMAVKSPPAPMAAPVYNWTGWYVGVNAGASMGNANTDLNNNTPIIQQGGGPGGQTATFNPGIALSNREYPDGFIGGAQIGYNWQYSPLIVVGLEADFQGAVEKDSITLTNSFNVPVTLNNPNTTPLTGAVGTSVTNYSTQIDWFGTVRARIGYVWGNGEVLSYVTGGLAYGQVKINGTNTTTTIVDTIGPFSESQAFGQSHVNTGWVLGYGTEGHLPLMPGNWTWKIETLYMDLGHLNTTGATTGTSAPVGPPVSYAVIGPGQVTTNTHFTDWILRGGLNYRF